MATNEVQTATEIRAGFNPPGLEAERRHDGPQARNGSSASPSLVDSLTIPARFLAIYKMIRGATAPPVS